MGGWEEGGWEDGWMGGWLDGRMVGWEEGGCEDGKGGGEGMTTTPRAVQPQASAGASPTRDSRSTPAANRRFCRGVLMPSPCSVAKQLHVMPAMAVQNARPMNTRYASDTDLNAADSTGHGKGSTQ
jgi:hypothetical protein